MGERWRVTSGEKSGVGSEAHDGKSTAGGGSGIPRERKRNKLGPERKLEEKVYPALLRRGGG